MKDRPNILCVDDERNVLDGLSLTLRTSFATVCFTRPLEALLWLRQNPETTVILSDMRMPEMTGAEFLSQSVSIAPHASRILLTGQTDISSAVKAVNDGKLYKFLTKPCVPTMLKQTVADAHTASLAKRAEVHLLEKTVNGCVHALIEVLVLTKPGALGRALQIKSLSTKISNHIGLADKWKIEMAALFCNLGRAFLTEEVLAHLRDGSELTDEDKKQISSTQETASKILQRIPRLEEIADIISASNKLQNKDDFPPQIIECAQVLKISKDFESLKEKQKTDMQAIILLEKKKDEYSEAVFDALKEIISINKDNPIKEVRQGQLRVGMTLAEDLLHSNGTLLLSQGQVLSESAVDQLMRVPIGNLSEPILIYNTGDLAA